MKTVIITSALIPNHAVTNSVLQKYYSLVKNGFEVSILAERIETFGLAADIVAHSYVLQLEDLDRFSKGETAFTPAIEKWYDAEFYLYDYPHYYRLSESIKRVDGIIGFIYHGITPPAFAEPGKRDFYSSSMMYVHLMKRADFGFVYSDYTEKELISEYKFEKKKLFKIPFGVDTKLFNGKLKNKKLKKENQKILSYIGRISLHKNIEFLIRCLPEILKKEKNVLLRIIGEDRGEYGREKTRLLKIAEELGIKGNIEFTGMVEDLADYYAASDLIVTASLHEGCWVPGFEAIASKKPIVAINKTAIPFTVGNAGLLFEPANEKKFISEVLSVLTSKSVGKKLLAAAEARIPKISIEAHNKAFIQVVKDGLKKGKKKTLPHEVEPSELLERLELLEKMKNIRVDYREFSDRKYVGSTLSKFRDVVTRHIRRFYIKPLETAQQNFNEQLVEEVRMILEYLARRDKWTVSVQDSHAGHSHGEELDHHFYNEEYFIGGNKSNYGDYQTTENILLKLGDILFDTFHPKTLLDIGCAYGYVPIQLRKKGVEAYGVDISSFAISRFNKPYLSVADAADLAEFKNNQVEVVFASEMMEHVPAEMIDKTIKEAKRVAGKYIVYLIAMKGFASHEGNHDHDKSHVSVFDRKFWLQKFEKHNLVRDIEKEAILHSDPYSVAMGWSGRFFVLKKK